MLFCQEEKIMGWATKYISELQNNKTISFRPHGNSMLPLIKSGQLCTLEPITDKELLIGDIVLCKVSGRQFLHIITAIEGTRYRISNNKGHHNGWCSKNNIFGKLIKVEN